MIKVFLILLFTLYISNGVCGVSVVGTRFLIDADKSYLNIKIMNDNESDYLIKSVVDDNDFIVSPPLFLLPKDSSNTITIILKEKKTYNKDKLFNLTVTAIPKSTLNTELSNVSLAIRSHFKVIVRHAELKSHDFSNIAITIENNRCVLYNNSNFVFTLSLMKSDTDRNKKLINLSPSEKIVIENASITSGCETWVNFHDGYNDIIKIIKLTT